VRTFFATIEWQKSKMLIGYYKHILEVKAKPNHLYSPSWSGTADIFGAENLMDKDVILVTLNYRHTSSKTKSCFKGKARGDFCISENSISRSSQQRNDSYAINKG